LQRQQPNLRAIAVPDHELVLAGDRRKRLSGDAHIRAHVLRSHWFSPAQ